MSQVIGRVVFEETWKPVDRIKSLSNLLDSLNKTEPVEKAIHLPDKVYVVVRLLEYADSPQNLVGNVFLSLRKAKEMIELIAGGEWLDEWTYEAGPEDIVTIYERNLIS